MSFQFVVQVIRDALRFGGWETVDGHKITMDEDGRFLIDGEQTTETGAHRIMKEDERERKRRQFGTQPDITE